MQIAVISGKGGTGKSSISAALATVSNNVVLADCDVDAANLYILFNPDIEEELPYSGSRKAVIDYNKCTSCGLCMDYCRFDAITSNNGMIMISEISCDGCGLCSRICPVNAVAMEENNASRLYSGTFRNGMMVYGRLAPGEETSGKLVNLVKEKAKQLAAKHHLETIILDGPPGIGCPMISTIAGTDHIIIVTEPSMSALSDLQRAMDVIMATSIAMSVIINKYNLNPDISAHIEHYCKECGIEVLSKLPFDRQVVDAMIHCKSMIEYALESSFSQKIRESFQKIKDSAFPVHHC
jgi:MinD superfamily P-loop ATPase